MSVLLLPPPASGIPKFLSILKKVFFFVKTFTRNAGDTNMDVLKSRTWRGKNYQSFTRLIIFYNFFVVVGFDGFDIY